MYGEEQEHEQEESDDGQEGQEIEFHSQNQIDMA